MRLRPALTSLVAQRRFSISGAGGTFPDQGSNPCRLPPGRLLSALPPGKSSPGSYTATPAWVSLEPLAAAQRRGDQACPLGAGGESGGPEAARPEWGKATSAPGEPSLPASLGAPAPSPPPVALLLLAFLGPWKRWFPGGPQTRLPPSWAAAVTPGKFPDPTEPQLPPSTNGGDSVGLTGRLRLWIR